MGLEGMVSKRKDSPTAPGRSTDCLKFKNPGGSGGEARRGGGLEQMTRIHSLPRERWGEK
jgi:hypothetical protein